MLALNRSLDLKHLNLLLWANNCQKDDEGNQLDIGGGREKCENGSEPPPNLVQHFYKETL